MFQFQPILVLNVQKISAETLFTLLLLILVMIHFKLHGFLCSIIDLVLDIQERCAETLLTLLLL